MAIVLLTARNVGTNLLTPILDIVPERVSAEAGAIVFGQRPALLRVGSVQCLNGVGGEIVDGKGKISRSYEADSTTADVEPTSDSHARGLRPSEAEGVGDRPLGLLI